MVVRVPSGPTTVWVTSRAGTSAGQYTPNACSPVGGVLVKKPA